MTFVFAGAFTGVFFGVFFGVFGSPKSCRGCAFMLAALMLLISPRLFALATDVAAPSFASKYWRDLIHTRSIDQVRAVSDEDREMESAERICRVQLRGSLVPTKCFAILAAEEKMQHLSSAQRKFHADWLDRICRERAENLETPVADLELNEPNLTPGCREAIVKRSSDMAYVARYANPEQLFLRRSETFPETGLMVRKLNSGSKRRLN